LPGPPGASSVSRPGRTIVTHTSFVLWEWGKKRKKRKKEKETGRSQQSKL
jgi:hypothetical protein